MRNKSIFSLVLFLALALPFFTFPVFSQNTESITITTYYPAPYGVYQQLRLFPHTPDPAEPHPCTDNEEGTIYYDDNLNALRICRQTTTSPDTYGWGYADSVWTELGDTGPTGTNPRAIYPIDKGWKVGIGNIDVAWNRSERLSVVDNESTNVYKEKIALLSVTNPRMGTQPEPAAGSMRWSGENGSVAALLLNAGNTNFQVRTDNFADGDGVFMIHQDPVATRLVIRGGTGNVGIGTATPQAKLDVNGEAKIRISSPALECNADTAGAMRYNSGKMEYCNGSAWRILYSELIRTESAELYADNGQTRSLNLGSHDYCALCFDNVHILTGKSAWRKSCSVALSGSDWILSAYNHTIPESIPTGNVDNYTWCKAQCFDLQ